MDPYRIGPFKVIRQISPLIIEIGDSEYAQLGRKDSKVHVRFTAKYYPRNYKETNNSKTHTRSPQDIRDAPNITSRNNERDMEQQEEGNIGSPASTIEDASQPEATSHPQEEEEEESEEGHTMSNSDNNPDNSEEPREEEHEVQKITAWRRRPQSDAREFRTVWKPTWQLEEDFYDTDGTINSEYQKFIRRQKLKAIPPQQVTQQLQQDDEDAQQEEEPQEAHFSEEGASNDIESE